MRWKNSARHYASLSITLHWLMLLVIVGVYICINVHNSAPKGSALRDEMIDWHAMFGLTILLLVCIRLVARLTAGPAPVISPAPDRRLLRIGTGMHWLLYLFMFVMPILGWCVFSAAGHTIPFWGLHLPPLLGVNKSLAHDLGEIHGTIGDIGYYLIGAHAAAALFHHYLLRDNTLLRMLPAWRGNKD